MAVSYNCMARPYKINRYNNRNESTRARRICSNTGGFWRDGQCFRLRSRFEGWRGRHFDAREMCFAKGGLYEARQGPIPACCKGVNGIPGLPNCDKICPDACFKYKAAGTLARLNPGLLGHGHMACREGCGTGHLGVIERGGYVTGSF